MEREFVTYEIALALKELGFDEPCFGWYDGRYIASINQNYCKNSEEWLNTIHCAAPLYQQVFRWLREKYGLHRHICYFNDTNVWHGDIYKIQNEGLMNNPMELTNYKTYEEAELACLIKLIEIVKSK